MTDNDFMWLGEALTTKSYRYAKTMPRHPHWYSMRQEWERDEDFVRSVKLLRKYGYDRRFYSKTYKTFDLNEYYYWTMGEPIDKDGKPWTYILNRALRVGGSVYDSIGEKYDNLFSDAASLEENELVMESIGWKDGESVLDIGCGTGLFLEYNRRCEKYLGVDPSRVMLGRMGKKFPDAATVLTDFEHFYTGEKFDLVVSTFGSCSYIDPKRISRVKRFMADGGRMFLMFYKDGYNPITYDKTGVSFEHYSVGEYLSELKDANVDELHEFVVVTS